MIYAVIYSFSKSRVLPCLLVLYMLLYTLVFLFVHMVYLASLYLFTFYDTWKTGIAEGFPYSSKVKILC